MQSSLNVSLEVVDRGGDHLEINPHLEVVAVRSNGTPEAIPTIKHSLPAIRVHRDLFNDDWLADYHRLFQPMTASARARMSEEMLANEPAVMEAFKVIVAVTPHVVFRGPNTGDGVAIREELNRRANIRRQSFLD